MCIFNHFQHINLTNDQQKSLDKIQIFMNNDERIFILQGYAGSGKTTLLKGFVEYLNSIEKRYQLMAPTGRAAKVIHQKTGFEASTIHRGIYSFAELVEIETGKDDNDLSFLYAYKLRNNPDVHNSVLIIDEASMVSNVYSQGEFFRFGSGKLLNDLIEYSRINDSAVSSKIIFVGDPAQLPPVGMSFSPAISSEYLMNELGLSSTFSELKEVKRQKSTNGILKSAMNIRKCLTSGFFNDFDLRENGTDIFNPSYEGLIDTYNSLTTDKILICYKNTTAKHLNDHIRNNKFGGDFPIQKSDIVIIGANNYKYGLFNGEFGVVSFADKLKETRKVSFNQKGGGIATVTLKWRDIHLMVPDERNNPINIVVKILENYLYGDNYLSSEEMRALYIDFKNRNPNLKIGTEEFKKALKDDPYFNSIHLKFGYAVTAHKAQGGEWKNAFVFWDKGVKNDFNFFETVHIKNGKSNPDFYRWAYTAITRASEKLYCINPPRFSSFTSMNFIDELVQNAFNSLTGKPSTTIDVNYTDVLPDLEKLGMKSESVNIQNHFIQRYISLRKHYVDVSFWRKVGYEIWYVFSRENQTAAVKYWINAKDEFKLKFQQIPSKTNSGDFYNDIVKLLENLHQVSVNRNSVESIISKIEFDLKIEEEKPFLKILYDRLSEGLDQGESISEIQHLEYRERYTFEKNNTQCIVDFEYNSDGFFGRVLPLVKKCKNMELLEKIQKIVNCLEGEGHVI